MTSYAIHYIQCMHHLWASHLWASSVLPCNLLSCRRQSQTSLKHSSCRPPFQTVAAAIPYLVLCPGCSAANQDILTAVLSSEVPATPLGSFPAIFNQALALGTLSRRRVYHEALQQQQRQKQKNRRWQAGLQKRKLALDVPCRSAANTAEVSDFHWHLASNDRVRCDQPNTLDVLLIVLGESPSWGLTWVVDMKDAIFADTQHACTAVYSIFDPRPANCPPPSPPLGHPLPIEWLK